MKKWTVSENGKLEMTYEQYMTLSAEEKTEIKANFSYEEFPGWVTKAWYVKPDGLANVEVVVSENLRRKVAMKPERAKEIFASDELAAKAGIHPVVREIVKEKLGI